MTEPSYPSASGESPGRPAWASTSEHAPSTDATTDDAAPPVEPPVEDPTPAEEEPPKDEKRGSFLRELPVLIAVALVLALLIKAFLVQAFYIPSGSMENTLRIGDRVLVNKLVYRFRDIHRGEIVVFNGNNTSFEESPETTCTPPKNAILRAFRSFASAIGVAPPCEKDFIKRVIGISGDRVECCDAQGRVTVNSVPLDEPYIFPGDKPSNDKFGPVTVPKGRIWVMGDHRSASQDSRAHISSPDGGMVPVHKVVGRAFVKVWPLSHVGGLPVPKTFSQKALNTLGSPFTETGADPALALGALGAFPVLGLRRRRSRVRSHRGPG
jgi:signal peptidase I